MNLSTIFKLKGINLTLSAACVSGSHCIGLGYMFIKNGMQDMIVCGGGQETNIYSMPNFDALGAFSIRENDPTKPSRPFDPARDGLVPSGGAATVIIESLESAQRRGATILAEVVGYGFSSNGAYLRDHLVGPSCILLLVLKYSPQQVDHTDLHKAAGNALFGKCIFNQW